MIRAAVDRLRRVRCHVLGHRWQLTVAGVGMDQYWCARCGRMTGRKKQQPAPPPFSPTKFDRLIKGLFKEMRP